MKNLTLYIAFICSMMQLNMNATNSILPKGIIYQVSVNATEIELSKQVIYEYAYLSRVTDNNGIQYQFGNYTNFNQVDSVKNILIEVGCNSTSVLAFNNQEEISVAEAISLQYENKIYTQNQNKNDAQNFNKIEANYLLQIQKSGLKHFYTLAIPIQSTEIVDKILDEIGNDAIVNLNKENNIYTIGKYNSFKEVLAARKKYIGDKIDKVYIMAEIIDDRISPDDTSNLAIMIQSVVNNLASK